MIIVVARAKMISKTIKILAEMTVTIIRMTRSTIKKIAITTKGMILAPLLSGLIPVTTFC
jgi:hypothetical protein